MKHGLMMSKYKSPRSGMNIPRRLYYRYLLEPSIRGFLWKVRVIWLNYLEIIKNGYDPSSFIPKRHPLSIEIVLSTNRVFPHNGRKNELNIKK